MVSDTSRFPVYHLHFSVFIHFLYSSRYCYICFQLILSFLNLDRKLRKHEMLWITLIFIYLTSACPTLIESSKFQLGLLSRSRHCEKKKREKTITIIFDFDMQLDKAMEALLNIWRDGCRAIGPTDNAERNKLLAYSHLAKRLRLWSLNCIPACVMTLIPTRFLFVGWGLQLLKTILDERFPCGLWISKELMWP